MNILNKIMFLNVNEPDLSFELVSIRSTYNIYEHNIYIHGKQKYMICRKSMSSMLAIRQYNVAATTYKVQEEIPLC